MRSPARSQRTSATTMPSRCADTDTAKEKAATIGREPAEISFDLPAGSPPNAATTPNGASCPLPFLSSMYYTLWVNSTANYNDHSPSFMNPDYSNYGTAGFLLRSRYFALQHGLNLAITDVHTGVTPEQVLAA
jgi:hypothetical protein